MCVIFILFLSPSYHFPNATNNLWSPPLCTFKQRISPKLQSDTALQCLMLAEFLITNLFIFFKTSIPGLVLDLEAGGPACSRRAGAWWSWGSFQRKPSYDSTKETVVGPSNSISQTCCAKHPLILGEGVVQWQNADMWIPGDEPTGLFCPCCAMLSFPDTIFNNALFLLFLITDISSWRKTYLGIFLVIIS